MQLAKKEYESRKKSQMHWIMIMIVYMIMIPPVCFLALQPVHVVGQSMFPAIINGDRILFSEVLEPRRFDIVLVKVEEGPQYCKRIIGMPGDEIRLAQQTIFINGEAIRERYLYSQPSYKKFTIKLGDKQYFVLGDNREASRDSRSFGSVDRDQIKGRMVFRLWRSLSSQSTSQ